MRARIRRREQGEAGAGGDGFQIGFDEAFTGQRDGAVGFHQKQARHVFDSEGLAAG